MTDPSEVRVEIRDGVGVISLAAPQRRNALSAAMAREVKAAVDELAADQSVGCLLVRGEGPSFCAGADRALLKAAANPADETARAELEDVYQSFIALGKAAIPSISAVQGWAVGAGLNLALAADIRIAARDAQLLAGFGRLQIHPGGGHLHLLERLGGTGVAAAMALFDQPVSGERAADLGLVWRAVNSAELEDQALAIAAGPARTPALARRMKESLRAVSRPDEWQAAIDLERTAQLDSLAASAILQD